MSEAIEWEIDGVSLSSEAWGVADWGGSAEAPPSLRGGGFTVPYRPGQVWAPRVAESRTIEFDMWVTDQDPISGVHYGEAQLLDNWATLRALFWGDPTAEREITKTWDASYGAATGRGVFAGGLEPSNFALTGAKFSASLLLADPWLYGAEMTLGTFAVGTHDVTGDILGDAASPRYTVTFTGPLNTPGVAIRKGATVLSTVTLRAALTAGQSWAITMPDGGYTGLAGLTGADVSASRAAWCDLAPPATALVVSGTGAGSVTVEYEPAYT